MTTGQNPEHQPEKQQVVRDIPFIQKEEKLLLDKANGYRGFPFEKERKYDSLDQKMQKFRENALKNARQVADGEIPPEQGIRSLMCVAGLPGVGKTEMVDILIDPWVNLVAEEINQKYPNLIPPASVHIASEAAYEKAFREAYVGPGKKYPTLDTTQPYPPQLLRDLWNFMDTGVADLLRQNPNLLVVMDRPSGTTFPLKHGTMWESRPYGLIPADIAKGVHPYDNIPLEVTPIGIIAGPTMLPRVNMRDQRIKNAPYEQIVGAPRATVDYVHQRQWALLTNILDSRDEGRQKLLEDHVPAFILDYMKYYLQFIKNFQNGQYPHKLDDLAKIEQTKATWEYLHYDFEGIALWTQVEAAARLEPPGKQDRFVFLWKLFYDFAGAQVLQYDLGENGTIVYNAP